MSADRARYRAFIWSMAVIKRAAATVLRDLGLLETSLAEAIRQAADEVSLGKWDAEFVVDPFQAGAGTSHHMNLNEVIANRATLLLGGRLGEYRAHPNDHVNMSQSTNDTIPTAIRLGWLWRMDEVAGQVEALAAALEERATAFGEVVKSGRTHLQDPVSVTLGQEFGGYGVAVRRDGERVREQFWKTHDTRRPARREAESGGSPVPGSRRDLLSAPCVPGIGGNASRPAPNCGAACVPGVGCRIRAAV